MENCDMAGTVKVEEWGGGAAFRIKVHAGGARGGVGGSHDGMLKVSVSAAPEKGKANREVVRLVAESLGLPPSGVEIISGETRPRKRIGVAGASVAELEARLGRIAAGDGD